jgi:hypothetical protein
VEAKSTSGVGLHAIGTGGQAAQFDGHVAISGTVAVGAAGDQDIAQFSNSGNGSGVYASSKGKEGIHGESESANWAGVTGIASDPAGRGPGVSGESKGQGAGVVGFASNPAGTNPGVWAESKGLGAGVAGFASNPAGTNPGVWAESKGQGAGVAAFASNPAGTGPGVWAESKGQGPGIVAIGKPAGQFRGDVEVSGTLTVGKDIVLFAADCAEEFDIVPALEGEPGTVMVLTNSGALEPSRNAYDKKVAGIISGAGDYRPGMILDRRDSSESRRPVALVGKAYCKVDAQYGRIEVGDLLTTSPTPGHAMKADDPLMAFGAVIGKALHRLTSGQGLIPVLVALQ